MKNEKEKDKKLNNQSSSLIAIVSCISVLMLIAFYGVSLASKGTYSIDDETCTYSYVGNWVGQTASIEKSDAGCNCPNGWDQSYSYQYLYCSTALTNANNGLSYNRGGMTSCANGYQSTLEGDGCVKCNEGYRLSDEAGAATCVPDGSGTGAQVGNECETTGGQAGVIGADGTCVSNSIDDESGTNTDCIWGWSVVDFSNKRAQLTVNKLSCGCPNGWDLSVDSQGVCLKDLVVTTNGYKFERGNFTLGGNACPSDFTLNSSDECVYTTPNNGTAKTVTFTFKNDDDSDYAKQSCTIAADSDRCILYAPGTEPTSKTNAGVFNGWGSEKGCTDGSLAANAEFNNITRTTENKTYYACYTKK